MNSKREKIIVGIATLIFFGAFGVVYLMDEPHGDVIGNIDQSNVRSKIILDQGHFNEPSLPDGLLILGAGNMASLKFEVINEDTEGDVDTILISIPDSEITNSSYEWYETGVEHQWNATNPDDETLIFEAQDDFMGTVSGGSPQYDVAGNIDDALDSVDGTNEGITLTVQFKVPTESGMKMGVNSIDLKVGNLKTEDPGTDLASVEPYPYPYIVSQNEDIYKIYVLKTDSCDLDVKWGSDQLFSSESRANDFMTSDHGFKYRTDEGYTVAVLENPGDEIVKPIIRARESGLTGYYDLDILSVEINDIDTGTVSVDSLVSDYQGMIPTDTSTSIDADIDGDGILNGMDDDIDGDGILNGDDLFPEIYNRAPVIITSPQDITVKEGEAFTLEVEAEDPDDETVSYDWKQDIDDSWSYSGNSVTISDLDPGTYNFTVEISDELGNIETRFAIVTVESNEPPVINSISADSTKIKTGDKVEITVDAEDPENDVLTYVWSHDQDQGWSTTGNPINVEDLEKGKYTFTVKVSDGRSEVTDEIIITVDEEDEGLGLIPFIVVAVIVVILIVVIALVMFFRKKDNQEDEQNQPIERNIQINTQMDSIQPTQEMIPETPQTVAPEYTDYPQDIVEEPLSEPVLEEPIQNVDLENGSEQDNSLEDETRIKTEACPECGADIGLYDRKCESCGAEFEIQVECPVCGQVSDGSEETCKMCGTNLES